MSLTFIVRRLNPRFHAVNQSSSEADNILEISDHYNTNLRYLKIGRYIFKVSFNPNVATNEIYLNYFHRRLLRVDPGATVACLSVRSHDDFPKIDKITFEIDTLRARTSDKFLDENTGLIEYFKREYNAHLITKGQKIAFNYLNNAFILSCEEFTVENELKQSLALYGWIDVSTTVYLKRRSGVLPTIKPGHEVLEVIEKLAPFHDGLGAIETPAASRRPRRGSIYGASASASVPLRSSSKPSRSSSKPPVSEHSNVYGRRPKRARPATSASASMQESVSVPTGDKLNGSRNLVDFNYNLETMGVGGLLDSFKEIFRRAFLSRLYPKEMIEKLGIKHIRGIIFHGPPGTGKTLLARKIGELLNCSSIKVVNGPELLNRFVGQSEENIRNLFTEAEEEYSLRGRESGLHLIILDEMDALCKKRGTYQGAAVHDSIVNQLLTKMDGVNTADNFLIIGMTNRLDLLDEALLRPGRFELHIEIGLPDDKARTEILQIYLSPLIKHNLVDQTINSGELSLYLSELTKNYTGAELEALVKSAVTHALNRNLEEMKTAHASHITNSASNSHNNSSHNKNTKQYGPRLLSFEKEPITIRRNDFQKALTDIIPNYGLGQTSNDLRKQYLPYGLLNYGYAWEQLENKLKTTFSKIRDSENLHFNVLVSGHSGTGLSALAVNYALELGSSCVKLITKEDILGLDETSQSEKIKELYDEATKSREAVIILDAVELLISYCRVGEKYSNAVLQSIFAILRSHPKKGRRVTVIATMNSELLQVFKGFNSAFDYHLEVPCLDRDAVKVLYTCHNFLPTTQSVKYTESGQIGIKQLLKQIF